MRTIEINDKVYRVEEAKTEQEQIEGLSDVAEMPEDVGMLFYFDPPQEIGMWMKDTIIPLDIIFFNEDQEVIKVAEGIPNDETLISANDVAYVLEVNRNSGIEVGDEFEFTDESDDEIINEEDDDEESIEEEIDDLDEENEDFDDLLDSDDDEEEED